MQNSETPLRLVSTDFDGTIFAEFENPPIAPDFVATIGRLQARGVKWVINTGRDMAGLMEALGRAHLPVQPDGLVLVEREIHFRDGSRFVAHKSWNNASDEAHAEIFRLVRRDLPRLVQWARTNHRATIYEDGYSPFCMIARDNTEADAIHLYLEEYCAAFPELCVVRNDVYARLAHKGFNKGSALAEICRQWKIPADQTFAIGDHLNDLPMLKREYARWVATNGNAVPSVKAAVTAQGGYVSPAFCGAGVADALNQVELVGKS